MSKFNLYKEIASHREIAKLSTAKIMISTSSLVIKYMMSVYLLDRVLDSVVYAKKYSDFLMVVFFSAGCVLGRLILQNSEKYYLNDALKMWLESVFIGKLFRYFRMETIDSAKEHKKKNEYKVNFVLENTYAAVDNLGLIIANMVLLLLTFLYVTKFSYQYLVIIIFPLMCISANVVIAEIEIKTAQKEAGVLQVIRELKRITDNKDLLNFFCNFSLADAFGQYKNKEFESSIGINKPNRRKMCFWGLVSSLFRVCAVFFAAVFISIGLLGCGKINATDVVVIISACHMMTGAVSVIVSKTTQNSKLVKTINGIYNEYLRKNLVEINKEINSLEMIDLVYRYGNDEKEMRYNIKLHKGDKVAVTGGNGCGKTTLLKILLGYIEPMSGEIIINNKLIRGHYHITNVVSAFEPFPLLNVSIEEYVTEGDEKIALSEDYGQMLEDLGVGRGRKLDFGNDFSAGTKQILNLIRVIYSKKTLIILDEPTSKLNPKLALPLVKKILSKDAMIIISTHDESVISLFGTARIICLDGIGEKAGGMA